MTMLILLLAITTVATSTPSASDQVELIAEGDHVCWDREIVTKMVNVSYLESVQVRKYKVYQTSD